MQYTVPTHRVNGPRSERRYSEVNELRRWASALGAELGIDTNDANYGLVLAMSREAARAVTKPAAPITAYLVGMAVARGLPPTEAARRLGELSKNWPRIDWRD